VVLSYGSIFYQIALKGTKDFVLKYLFLCRIDLSHTPGPILLVLVEIIALTFLINSYNKQCQIPNNIPWPHSLLRLCLLSPLNHQHWTPGIVANLCSHCYVSGGTVLVAVLARL